MRFALVALALVGTAAAQMNCFQIVPHKKDALSPNDVANIVTRCTLAPGNDMCQEIPGDFFGCVGAAANGQGNFAHGHCIRLDDFNGSTPDGYEIVIRPARAAPLLGPDCLPASEICRVGPFPVPLGAAVRVSHCLTVAWAAPCRIPDCVTFYIGWNPLTPTVNPPVDSLWLLGTSFRQNAAVGADPNRKDPACDCSRTLAYCCTAGVVGATSHRTLWLGILVECPTLNMGGKDPTLPATHILNLGTRGGVSYGAGGMWMCCRQGPPRQEYGIHAQLVHAPHANGVGVMFLGVKQCPGLFIGFAAGRLCLTPPSLIQLCFMGLDANGCGNCAIVPPNAGVCFLGLGLDFQGATVGATGIHLSNEASVLFCRT